MAISLIEWPTNSSDPQLAVKGRARMSIGLPPRRPNQVMVMEEVGEHL